MNTAEAKNNEMNTAAAADDIEAILNEQEDELMDDLYLGIKNTNSNMIKFDVSFNKPNNFIPQMIGFDEVNDYDFSKGFNEFLIGEDKVHLYFDFDSIKSEEEYLSVIDWLDKVKAVFGNYSIGGYCDNETMERYGFRLYEDGGHYLSIHVIFYQTCILSKDLVDIMKHTKKKGFAMDGVHHLCDPNVYKLVGKKQGEKSRQVMRHVLSDKIFRPGDEKNKRNHGYILNGDDAASQIIQIRGGEPLITKQKWSKLFTPKETKMQERQRLKEERVNNKFDIDDIELNEDLIEMNEKEMMELLSHFDPEFDVFMCDLAPLYHSPFQKPFLKKVILKWYEGKEHTHDPEATVDGILNKYYEKERSNKWFFSLIKKLPQEVREEYLAAYGDRVDFSIDINNSNWSFDRICKFTYERHELARIINNMRGCFGMCKGNIYLKEEKDKQFYIRESTMEKMREEFTNYKPFKRNHNINLFQILRKYSMCFRYEDVDISADNRDGVINIFQGFKFPEIKTDDFTMLNDFLKHIKDVICNGDESKYDYYMKWFASIFQQVTVKNGTMPIIYGAQGSGKSFPTEVFAGLIGCFALPNVDDLDKVFGKFNGLIGRNILICINETPDSTEKFKYLNKIKSKLTETDTVMERKGFDQINIKSWANYILTSNNANPIQEEKGNRRLIYFETNNKYCGNEEYFNKLCKTIQPKKQGPYNPTFMGVLLHYMKTQIDVSDFNPERLIRKINSNTNVEFNEQLERQYNDLNAVDRFVVDNYKMFELGLALEDIRIEGYKPTGLSKKLISTCDRVRVRKNKYQKLINDNPDIYGSIYCQSNQVTLFKLKSKEQIPDLHAIIEYRAYGDQLLEEEERREAMKEGLPFDSSSDDEF